MTANPDRNRFGFPVETGLRRDSAPRRKRRIRRRIAHVWRRYRWYVTASLALIAFGLGYYGWGVKSGRLSPLDRAYYTLALFRLGTAGVPPYPTTLEIARWLAPATTTYAFFRAAAAVFSEQWTRLHARLFARHHVIVCGLGLIGSRLARALHDQGASVVAVDRNPSESDLAWCRENGIGVLRGDATDPELLRQAGLARAHWVIAVCGQDEVNAEVELVIRGAAQTRHGRLRCFVHVADEPLCRLLQQVELSVVNRGLVTSEYFNVYRAGPRALLTSHPWILEQRGDRPPNLVVTGQGPLAVNLVVEAARRWGLTGHHTRLRVTLLRPDANAVCVRLQRENPHLEKVCDLEARPGDAADAHTTLAAPLEQAADVERAVVLVCESDDAACLRAAIRLRLALQDTIPIVVCITGAFDIAGLFDEASGRALANVHGFALLDEVCGAGVLYGDAELIAQAIHADYVRFELSRDPSARAPALAPWPQLAETYREASREQADDIGRKLAAVGYTVVPVGVTDSARLTLSDEELDRLACFEHERWEEERIRAGWRYGPKRDDARKVHPDLVPWEELSEEDKEKDRNTVRNIRTLLAAAGFGVARHR